MTSLGLSFLSMLAMSAMSLMTNTTTGCGVHAIDFNSSGHATRTLSGRTYLLHIPANYDSSKTHAVVLSYHGYDGTSAQQEILSQFSDPGVLINGRGIIAAYPQGALGNRTLCSGALEFKSAWQGAPYASPGVDDVQFTKDIITDISSNLCVDNTRIYAAGKSNGGGFVNLLACQPDTAPLFAAFAPVSAALYPGTHAFSNCTPGRPVPIINFHGLNDTTIPFAGKSSNCGGNSTTPDIPTWRAQWAQRNGCVSVGGQLLPNATSVINPFPNTAESIWNCSAPVEGFTVNGLAHSWPTTQGLDKSGAPLNVAQFNATVPPIINFFNQFALPS